MPDDSHEPSDRPGGCPARRSPSPDRDPVGGLVNPDYQYLATDLYGDFSTRDPTDALARIAAGEPFQRVPQTGAVFAVRAADMPRLLADQSLGSRRPPEPRLAVLPPAERAAQERMRSLFALWPVFSDGVYHDQVRRVVVRSLRDVVTPDRQSTLDGLVIERIESLGSRSFEWTEMICRPVARQMVAAMVGEADADLLIDLGRTVIDLLNTPAIDSARTQDGLAAVAQVRDWLETAITVASTAVIAGLADLWWDDRLGPDSATAVLMQLVTGAYDPTISALGVIAERVDGTQLARLSTETLREEVLRIAAPFRFTSRFARQPVTVGPYRLEPGERVILGLGTANFDAQVFPEPSVCRRREGSPRGFSFGGGPHYCPGVHVASAVVDAVLKGLARQGVSFVPEVVDRHPGLSMLRYQRLYGRLVPYDAGETAVPPRGMS